MLVTKIKLIVLSFQIYVYVIYLPIEEFFVAAYPSKCPEKGLLSINNNVALKNLSNLAKFASKEQIKTTLIKQLKR